MDTITIAGELSPPATLRAAMALHPGREFQFQLRCIQTYNWGTFDKLREIHIASQGHLVLGPSGSGKSTLLDGHTSLLTPPRWLDFNTAARSSEKGSGDRSLATYVRGAWATQTGEEGEKVKRYLRTGTTWSAISETYQDGTGRTVVLGRILWIKGNASAESDVHRLFFIATHEFNLRELEFFKDEGAGFEVRRLKAKLSDLYFTDEFGAYETRFMRLFDIKSDRALRLLHKTQSAKDLGDLNKFLRDFMLDPPETFKVSDTLVNEFQVLHAAHEAVLTARNQIDALRPVRDGLTAYEQTKLLLSLLAEEKVGVEYWREQNRNELLLTQIRELTIKWEGLEASIEELKTRDRREEDDFNALLTIRAGAGGNVLAHLQAQVEQAERVRVPDVSANHQRMVLSCKALDWALPASPETFAIAQSEARVIFEGRETMADRHEKLLDDRKKEKNALDERFAALLKEIRAMEGRTSNLPARLLEIRERMCHDLGIPEEELPFVGELLQVKAKESQWTGSVERVLGGLARDILVEERYYSDVAAWVDRTHLGLRLGYRRMAGRATQSSTAQPAANSLLRKLDIAPKHKDWLSEELRRFDYACVDTAEELRKLERGVTLAGQVKHNRSLHEKDDSRRVNDRSNWVLGFSNAEKLQAYQEEFFTLQGDVDKAEKALEQARETAKNESRQVEHCQNLVNLSWENSNIAALLDEIRSLKARIEQEFKARPELSELDKKVGLQRKAWDKARKALLDAQGDAVGVRRECSNAQKRVDELPAEKLSFPLSPTQKERLAARFEKTGKKMTVDQLDSACTAMVRAIGDEESTAIGKTADIKQGIEHKLYLFCNRWTAEAQGLDPKLESAPDFMAKLQRLETDGLHEYVARFKALLSEQSDQNLAVLHSKLDQERRNIGERMEQVNDSLRRCAFNENTYLKINYDDKPTQEVIEFRGQLKAALSHSFKDDDDEEMERRFAALNAVVQRLGSQQPADVKWRSLVLDVRQHVIFSATEFDDTSIEVETYDSGAGKSGGQRQKLTTTVLAAALRYQLAGEDGVWPTYSTVVMDEAFDRADNEFTAMVMNIFKSFGFQVVAATPVKNVMALEPFIGGGTFVSIRDRKHSEALAITYVDQTGRLDLPFEAQEVLAEELTADSADAPAGEPVA
ncbi:ATP-binding protein [Polaromonas sp. LjRoot131]|uniref:ATP-binding protein n=1 Tax=Polaromonas sp. LjRoot131 TaxID=3342262 RepID=UPI003ECEB997